MKAVSLRAGLSESGLRDVATTQREARQHRKSDHWKSPFEVLRIVHAHNTCCKGLGKYPVSS